MVQEEIGFKDFSYLGSHSGSPFVWQSGIICAFFIEGIMRNYSLKLFLNLDQWFRRQVKDISYLELLGLFCLPKHHHLCNFGRRHHEEHFSEIIYN